MSLSTHTFENSDELVTVFSQRIADTLKQAIAEKDQATLVVSGGSTPLPLFKSLCQRDLDWSKVVITLADERWVDAQHSASNEKLVRENLLQQNAANATFISLTTNDELAADAVEEITSRFASVSQPFDVLILGMGEDGHTASLFPCSEQIEAGLDTNSSAMFIATQPTTAPHQRMSLTLKALISSANIYLHLTGEKKKNVLEDALANYTEIQKPIKAVCDRADVQLMWAP